MVLASEPTQNVTSVPARTYQVKARWLRKFTTIMVPIPAKNPTSAPAWFAFLFQVPTYDLVTLGGAAIAIVLVAIAASYLPARRATGIDPAKALRQN